MACPHNFENMNDDFFDNKKYIGKWTPIYYFAGLGDTDNFFIELKYFINKTHYLKTKSDIGTALDFDMLDYDGIGVFAGIPETTLEMLKNRNYKLAFVSDGIEYNDDGDLLIVSETYSYAPSKTYISYENDIVPIWGLKDEDFSTSVNVVFGSKKNVLDTEFFHHSILHLADVSGFQTGDSVRIKTRCIWSQFDFLGAFVRHNIGYFWVLDTFKIIAIDRKKSTIEIDYALSMRDLDTSRHNHHDGYYYTWRYVRCTECFWDTLRTGRLEDVKTLRPTQVEVVKAFSTREFKRRDMPIRIKTTFSTSQPQAPKMLVPKYETGFEFDTISRETMPSTMQWKRKIENGSYFQYAEADVQFDEINKIYKMQVKETKCQ